MLNAERGLTEADPRSLDEGCSKNSTKRRLAVEAVVVALLGVEHCDGVLVLGSDDQHLARIADLLHAEVRHQVSRILFDSLNDSSTRHDRVEHASKEERSVHDQRVAKAPGLDDERRVALARDAALIAVADLAQANADEG